MLASRPVQHLQHHDYLNAKTPGRENSGVHRGVGGAKTVQGKGRLGVAGAVSQKDLAKTAPRLVTQTQSRPLPLGDKTPFPNQASRFVTPLPGEEKIAKLNLGLALNTIDSKPSAPTFAGTTPDSVLRPSSSRRHGRTPRISGGALVGKTSFVTPMNSGRHWDVDEGDIPVELAAPAPEPAEEDDYDDIEYMPPKLDLQYTPPLDFEIPDYSQAGKALLERMHSFPLASEDYLSLPEPTFTSENLHCVIDLPLSDTNLSDDLDLSLEDPFAPKLSNARATVASRAPSRPASTLRQASTLSSARSHAPVPVTRARNARPIPTSRPIVNSTTTTTMATKSIRSTATLTTRTTTSTKSGPTQRAVSVAANIRPKPVARPTHSRTLSASALPPTAMRSTAGQSGPRAGQNIGAKSLQVADNFTSILGSSGEDTTAEDFLFSC
ncbi:hypothetical protein MIND_00923800 [Mycena indigotica]|uniref:Uncharacterized protein n=1 Tax=Mycena indigotica TaxID=2126181 RepID=A0A8H6SFJ3_9AGAR|nr:uncharacterized protein MIND_00923800 [Mycena indigotica]KAF7296920.1 hypothetical protein MIND_00923800 [Mycena indigotica]